ncbi:MAG: Gldg family protein [Chloroflexi bacterium]|nr:Gldg family protein [Chloroflexota bacterium]
MKQTLSITRKELSTYFGSPMALIFVGAFLTATLFAFFWVDTFFARGIADVRPLFRWMPLLLIFLVAALTMRQWSEEQRSGTLEVLLTLPVSKTQLVLGKFLAVMALVALALALTLFLPITVSLMGNLDWGPVIGGYLAALLMAAAYTAIGLFVSSRTDNQIVALILTVLVNGLFYLVGTSGITDFAGRGLGNVLRAIGTSSRFESIQRGVVDLRDLVYYGTLAAIFLALNALSLDRKRWSAGAATTAYRRGVSLTSALLVVNLLAANIWVYPLNGLRLDLTAQQEYSLSRATKDLLGGLGEPLLIRGYISEKTHPLLTPLVPQISDMLREYEIAGRGKVTAEVVDPIKDPDVETEANQTYGIQPTPFQIAGRYESSVINSYFDILVRYGDQNTVLSFRDLIEVEQQRSGNPDVRLRNLEYDLTRAVKKVVYGFQSVDTVLASIKGPVKLTLFVTPATLPEELKPAPDTIAKVAKEIQAKAAGKFTFEQINPDAANSPINRQKLLDTYKLRPIAASLFSSESYYLDMALQIGDKTQLLNPGGTLSEADVRTAIESALKRSSTGFLKVVGFWTPTLTPTQDMFGQQQQPLQSWQQAQKQLSNDYTMRTVDLTSGQAPSDIDVLVLIAPQGMDDKARYAVDQYLMRGGSVVVAAGNYTLALDPYAGNLTLQPVEQGLQEMLDFYGVRVEQSLVMDPQNEAFPVQVARKVGTMTVQEIQAINYPFFVDVRADGMDKTSPIVSKLSAVTMNWASPITVDAEKNKARQVTTLLKSTPNSWLRTSADIQPDLQKYPSVGFPVEGDKASRPLAVAVSGSFESYFKGKPSPLGSQGQVPGTSEVPGTSPTPGPQAGGAIEASPETARLVVVGSAEFLTDVVFQISSSLTQDRYLNSLQFLQNAVDWSVEDLELLTIRSRGTQARVLAPMAEGDQRFWEALNYVLALVGLAAIGGAWYVRRRNEKPMELAPVMKEKAGK